MVCAGAQAASALSSITVDEAARSHAAEQTELLATFPALVADAYDSVQLFAVKLLGVFLERPQWRDVLREPVQPILEEIVATCADPFPPPFPRTAVATALACPALVALADWNL